MPRQKPSTKRKAAQAEKAEPEPLPERIREIWNTDLKQRATDAWRAVNVLLDCIRFWRDWVKQLRTTGDADPGHAWQCNQKVGECATILIRVGVNSKSFRGLTVRDILERFPDFPLGEMAQPEIRLKNHTVPAVKAWQETYPLRQAEERNRELAPFEGELRGIRELLKTAPSTVFLPAAVTPAAPKAGEDDFVQASVLWKGNFPTYKKFKGWLGRHPEVPQQRKGQRLLVHAGSFAVTYRKEEKTKEETAASANPEVIESVITGIEARKADVQRKKMGK
jgi:hypothetical protein